LKEIARLFAERRGQWLTQGDIINLIGDKYSNSTISSNFKKLSSPMKELEDHCYLETEVLDNRGQPIRAQLSEVAYEKLFRLVTPVIQKPASTRIGRIEVPPLVMKNVWLPPEDMVALRKQKIGEKEADCLLRDIAERKHVLDGDVFVTDYYDLKRHNAPGPIPQLHRLTDMGIMEFASDINQCGYSIDIYIAPNWAGIWETNIGRLEIVDEIVDEQLRYIGTYPNGTIEGKAEGDMFAGTWHEGSNSGDFEFTAYAGGRSFWGDRYDHMFHRLCGWNGKLLERLQ